MKARRSAECGIHNFLIVVMGFWLLWPAVTEACPLCKEILMDPGKLSETLSTAKGYALSIGVMLSIPALLIGGVTLLVVRSHRRKPLG